MIFLTLTDDEIIDAVLNEDKEENVIDEDEVPILEKVSLKEAKNSTDKIMKFLRAKTRIW